MQFESTGKLATIRLFRENHYLSKSFHRSAPSFPPCHDEWESIPRRMGVRWWYVYHFTTPRAQLLSVWIVTSRRRRPSVGRHPAESPTATHRHRPTGPDDQFPSVCYLCADASRRRRTETTCPDGNPHVCTTTDDGCDLVRCEGSRRELLLPILDVGFLRSNGLFLEVFAICEYLECIMNVLWKIITSIKILKLWLWIPL